MAASTPHLGLCSLISLPRIPTHKRRPSALPSITTRRLLKVRATAPDLLGDFGARDPFPAELESNFAENILGNVDTEHKILIPNSSALSLAEQECLPLSQLDRPLSEDEIKALMFKVVGWKVLNEEDGMKLQGLWKVRDAKCGEELINRIKRAVESTGHLPSLHFDEPNQVRADLWTASIGGLSINDFIVAAKIDKIKVTDLQPRVRVWA